MRAIRAAELIQPPEAPAQGWNARSQPLAAIVNVSNEVVYSTAGLRLPADFQRTLGELRAVLARQSRGPAVRRLAAGGCVRATPLIGESPGYLLLLFEQTSRRIGALQQLTALGLTPREREVGMQALDGLSNRAIAERLSVSENTVEVHVKKILIKAGASSRAALISRILGWPADDGASRE